MGISDVRNWCEEIDALLLLCDEQHQPSDAEADAVLRKLHRVLSRAPEAVKQHFHLPLEGAGLEPLFAHGALEKILFEITRNVGLMISRAPSGKSMATISIPDLDIECSFSNESSLAVAMAGSIAAAALELLKSGPDPQMTIN